MKWVKVNHEGQPTYGILDGSKISLTPHTWNDILSDKPVEIIAEVSQDSAVLLNPIGRPGKIICVGLNYLDHCRETNTPPPERPLLFTKFTTSMTGPNDDIVWSTSLTNKVDLVYFQLDYYLLLC